MNDPTPLTAQDYDVWQLASPAHLLALLKKLGVEGTTIATWLGVTPACVSQWHTGKRPIHPRYGPALRVWAKKTVRDEDKRNDKEVAAQPTDALRAATRAEFTALWARWKEQVLFDGGTLLKQAHQQYYALAGWVLKEHYRAEDIENAKLAAANMVAQMERVHALECDIPSLEDEVIARLTAAHEMAEQTREGKQDA